MGADLIQHLEKVLKRHVVLLGEHAAVGTAVAAVEVATQGAFPKQLVQLVLVDAFLQHLMVEFEHHALIKAELIAHRTIRPLQALGRHTRLPRCHC